MDIERMMTETVCDCFDFVPLYADDIYRKQSANEQMRELMVDLIMTITPAVAAGQLLPEDLVFLVLQTRDKLATDFPFIHQPGTQASCLAALTACGLLPAEELHQLLLEYAKEPRT